MKKWTWFTLAALGLGYSVVAKAETLEGYWKGQIAIPNAPLAIAVTLENEAEANWSGTIDIPAQGLSGFGLNGIEVEEGSVRFTMAGIPGEPTFRGEFGDDQISGTFSQGGQDFPFTLESAQPPKSDATMLDGIPGEGFAGEWLGVIQSGPMSLRLALSMEAREDGLVAELNSLDQGAMVPVAGVEVEARELVLTMPAINGTYEGTLNSDGSAIEGTWTQSGRDISLVFARQQQKTTLIRPQEPKPPFPYHSEDITFHHAKDAITLAGTLIIPEGEPPFPGVIFISGSGAQDRDEFLLGHKPFLVIADHLARHGIASLRYDDRGAGESEGDHMGSTIDQFLGDAKAALNVLHGHPSVDTVGIIGHSEGGVTGPRLAVADPRVRFLVLLAPPTVPITELLSRQSRDILAAQGVDPDLIARSVEDQKADLEFIVGSSHETDDLAEALRDRIDRRLDRYSAEERAALQMDDNSREQSLAMATSRWFRSLIVVDPADYLPDMDVPVLALFGEKDIQVAASENADRLGTLMEGSSAHVEIHTLEGLNHLLQHAETGSVEEYGQIEETISPKVLDIISRWIQKAAR